MNSIKFSLNIRQACIQIAIIAVFSTAIYKYIENQLIIEFDKNLETLAYAGSSTVEAEYEHGGIEIEVEREHIPTYNKDTTLFFLHGPQKDIKLNPNQVAQADWSFPPLPDSGQLSGETSLPDGRRARYLTLRFLPKEEDGRPYTGDDWFVTVASETSSIQLTLRSLLYGCIGLGVIATTLSILANYFSIRKGLHHLDTIGEDLTQLDAGNLQHQFPTSSYPSEIQPISKKLNELLNRIHSSFQREQRFTSNTAHELRTPLAELQAILQVGQKWTPQDIATDNPVDYFTDANHVTKRMSRLLETLFTLSRDSATIPASLPSKFCLRTELDKLVRNHANESRISIEGAAPFMVSADKDLLIASASNLICNALKHSSSQIEIQLHNHAKNGVSLQILNTATDLRKEDIPHLTEPFWRKQQSRTDQDHLGLGLNLVKNFCERQNWQLCLSINDEQKFCASIANIACA